MGVRDQSFLSDATASRDEVASVFSPIGEDLIEKQALGNLLKLIDHDGFWTDDLIDELLSVVDTNKDGLITWRGLIDWCYSDLPTTDGNSPPAWTDSEPSPAMIGFNDGTSLASSGQCIRVNVFFMDGTCLELGEQELDVDVQEIKRQVAERTGHQPGEIKLFLQDDGSRQCDSTDVPLAIPDDEKIGAVASCSSGSSAELCFTALIASSVRFVEAGDGATISNDGFEVIFTRGGTAVIGNARDAHEYGVVTLKLQKSSGYSSFIGVCDTSMPLDQGPYHHEKAYSIESDTM